ncbi:MAG: DUF3943 domain-containing protein [bacterium]
MQKNFLLIIILMVGFFLNNHYVIAHESEKEQLKNGIIKKYEKNNLEIVEFNVGDVTYEIIPLDNLDSIDLSKIEELKLSESENSTDTKKRLHKASSFVLLGGLSVSHSIEKSLRDGRADNRLSDNFTNPWKSAKQGWKADDNEWTINYVGHPLEWFILANYLKASGATNKEAIIISQLTSLTWEFVIEGNYVAPSPKDLVTNTLGSLAGVYLYNVILNKPSNATYTKLSSISKKHGIDILPQVKYNTESRGMMFGALIKVKR